MGVSLAFPLHVGALCPVAEKLVTCVGAAVKCASSSPRILRQLSGGWHVVDVCRPWLLVRDWHIKSDWWWVLVHVSIGSY